MWTIINCNSIVATLPLNTQCYCNTINDSSHNTILLQYSCNTIAIQYIVPYLWYRLCAVLTKIAVIIFGFFCIKRENGSKPMVLRSHLVKVWWQYDHYDVYGVSKRLFCCCGMLLVFILNENAFFHFVSNPTPFFYALCLITHLTWGQNSISKT